MISRTIEPVFKNLVAKYPVVTITGPRQSGKTTICRMAFPEMPYENLEIPDIRQYALDDPRGFLNRYQTGVILDEIQRAPICYPISRGSSMKSRELAFSS